jgi:hypothetical protein
MISISAAFDSGNIEVSSIEDDNVQLRVRDDPFSNFEQKTFKQARLVVQLAVRIYIYCLSDRCIIFL